MREFINANETIREDDHATITAAIQLACEDGCRTVKVPRYNARTKETKWSLMKAIQIPSNFTLLLDNCYMEQARGSYDHLIENEHAHDTDISNKPANATKNIRIIGEGHVILSGGEHNHLLEKTADLYGLGYIWWNQIMFWHNVDGLEVENVEFRHQRHWAVLHVFCRNGHYKNIHFFAWPHVPNMDGIDLRMGCHDFLIENLTGRTGDDIFAMTDYMGVREMSCYVPTEAKDIHDVTVRNVKAASHNCYLARILNHDGNKAYNVFFDTLMDASDPYSFRPGGGISIGSPYYFINYPANPGDTYNIRIQNLYTRAANAVIINRVCQDTTISNVHTHDTCGTCFWTMPDGMTIKNIRCDHIYHAPTQARLGAVKELGIGTYQGMFMNFDNVEGDIHFDHVEVDQIRVGFRANGKQKSGLKVEVNDYTLGKAWLPITHDGNAEVIVDGESKPADKPPVG